jgi:hypothetical protein
MNRPRGKRIVLLLAGIAAVVAATGLFLWFKPAIRESYDKSTGEHLVRTGRMSLTPGGLEMAVAWSSKTGYLLTFEETSPDPKYKEDHQLFLNWDGGGMSGKTEYTMTVNGGFPGRKSYTEMCTSRIVPLQFHLMDRLASAQKIEGRLGAQEFRLSRDQHDTFFELVAAARKKQGLPPLSTDRR